MLPTGLFESILLPIVEKLKGDETKNLLALREQCKPLHHHATPPLYHVNCCLSFLFSVFSVFSSLTLSSTTHVYGAAHQRASLQRLLHDGVQIFRRRGQLKELGNATCEILHGFQCVPPPSVPRKSRAT